MNYTSTSQSKKLFENLSGSWERRSRVRNFKLPDIFYETEKPDFLESLIPIKDSPAYISLSSEQKQKILSYGWLAYNAKTIAIESKIISPICYDIIDGKIPGINTNVIKKIISETLIDESYHILLSHYGMMMTEKYRSINRAIFPDFDLITKINKIKKQYSESWQKKLIHLSVAIVSEIFISDYLDSLSKASNIVSINQQITKTHRMDEAIHGRIFCELAKNIYAELSNSKKQFFQEILYYPVQCFASKEFSVWKSILDVVCPTQSMEIMEEIGSAYWYDLSKINYQNLILLAEELGIENFSADRILH